MPNKIGNPFVESQQDPAISKGSGNNDQIGRSRQVLFEDCVGVVPGKVQISNKIGRQVFVDLEFQGTCKGIKRSSCANSAAYARAASICSGRRAG